MYLRKEAGKKIIQYNSRKETEMSSTSDTQLRTSDLFVIEYCLTGKEADIHFRFSCFKNNHQKKSTGSAGAFL